MILTFKAYIKMKNWVLANPDVNEISFLEKFYPVCFDEVYNEWVEVDRFAGDDLKFSISMALCEKAFHDNDYEKLKSFLKDSFPNTIGYVQFLKLFDSFHHDYSLNPLKFDMNKNNTYKDSDFCIEPEVKELYIARLEELGWKRASRRKIKKVRSHVPEGWKLLGKKKRIAMREDEFCEVKRSFRYEPCEYFFRGNDYIGIHNNREMFFIDGDKI